MKTVLNEPGGMGNISVRMNEERSPKICDSETERLQEEREVGYSRKAKQWQTEGKGTGTREDEAKNKGKNEQLHPCTGDTEEHRDMEQLNYCIAPFSMIKHLMIC